MIQSECGYCRGRGYYEWKLCWWCAGTGEERVEEMTEQLVLFGAGSAGRYALRHLREKGLEPVAFADNNPEKQHTDIDGIPVYSPEECNLRFQDAVWVATAISRPAATEIRAHLNLIEVPTKHLWECLPVCHGIPTGTVMAELYDLCGDEYSKGELQKQYLFRKMPNYDRQNDPSPISELYFPSFIKHLGDEVFIDAGACQGDTLELFMQRWSKYRHIYAYEPDPANMEALLNWAWNLSISRQQHPSVLCLTDIQAAVSDQERIMNFTANGDYSSHFGGKEEVHCIRLDDGNFISPPTYIKADVEGAELELLWGARKLIKQHSPILAICAYHESDHLWEIPLLIHAINPEYKLFLRRYAEGAFELVWYAVPPGRVK